MEYQISIGFFAFIERRDLMPRKNKRKTEPHKHAPSAHDKGFKQKCLGCAFVGEDDPRWEVPENQAAATEQGGGRWIMPPLSDEQILRARDIDLLSYLQTHEPSNVRKNRSGEYYMVEHDSLKMSNGKWFRHSTQA